MEEKLVERVARAVTTIIGEHYGDYDARVARLAIEASGFTTLLSAAEAFISEAESMGWGERSETALPGSFDALVKAVREVKG